MLMGAAIVCKTDKTYISSHIMYIRWDLIFVELVIWKSVLQSWFFSTFFQIHHISDCCLAE